MIEINLIHNKKGFGGKKAASSVDVSQLNTKMLILAVVLLYAPDFLISDIYQGQKDKVQRKINAVILENKNALQELKEVRSLQNQVEQHQDKEKKLKAKLEIVREIISSRKNPFQILLYISKNIPETVWIESIKLEKNQLIIAGTASSYKSIGIFTSNLKNSIFFSFVTYRQTDTRTALKSIGETFKESFEITANIARYE